MEVAVVGAGSMGAVHIRNYAEMSGVRLVAICDVNEQIGASLSKKFKVPYYHSHTELLKKKQFDAVSIAVPTKFHKAVATDFISAHIPLLVEKPLAPNLSDAKALVKLAKMHNVPLLVGHVERYNPVITKLHDLIKKKHFGDILSITVKRVGLFPPRITDVDVITDLAVHDLDIICSILGKPPNSVFARGGGGISDGRIDHAEIFLDFGRFGCFLQVNWVTPIKIRTLSITGTKGHSELNYITQKMQMYKTKYREGKPYGFREQVYELGEPKKIALPLKSREPLRLEIENFIDVVKGRKRLLVTPEEGIRAVYLAELITKSIRTGKVQKVSSI